MIMDFEAKKLCILNALIERKGMQTIIDAASEVMNNPMLIADYSLKVLTWSNVPENEKSVWNGTLNMEQPNLTILQEVNTLGDFEKVYSSDEPVIGKYSFSDYRFLAARIRDGANVIGHIAVVEAWKSFEEDDKKLLIILCKAIVFEMLYRGQSSMHSVRYFNLIADLLDNKIQSDQEYLTRANLCGIVFLTKMQLLAIESNASSANISYYLIRERLLNFLAGSLGILYDNKIIILCDISQKHNENYPRIVSECLDAQNTKVGVSREFTDIREIRTYYEQALNAIKLFEKRGNNTCICFYDDVNIINLLKCASETHNILGFIDPLLFQLVNYDQVNGTDHANDLYVYLNSGRSINEAAKSLFVHKNSMYYRIAKIEEILGISLQDEKHCFSLQLSLEILHL